MSSHSETARRLYFKVGPHSYPSRWHRPFRTFRISSSAKHVHIAKRWISCPHVNVLSNVRWVSYKYYWHKKGVVNIFKTGGNSQEFRNILFFIWIVGKPGYIRIDRITFRSKWHNIKILRCFLSFLQHFTFSLQLQCKSNFYEHYTKWKNPKIFWTIHTRQIFYASSGYLSTADWKPVVFLPLGSSRRGTIHEIFLFLGSLSFITRLHHFSKTIPVFVKHRCPKRQPYGKMLTTLFIRFKSRDPVICIIITWSRDYNPHADNRFYTKKRELFLAIRISKTVVGQELVQHAQIRRNLNLCIQHVLDHFMTTTCKWCWTRQRVFF